MNIVICLSGGMDSATLLGNVVKLQSASKLEGRIHCLSFDYGQRHKKELESANRLVQWYQKFIEDHVVIDLSRLYPIFDNSALTGASDIPEGHYEDESMKVTVVPNRNMIMLAIATGYAINNNLDTVGYAAHAGDHAIYPDCRQAFVRHMRSVMAVAGYNPIHLYTPYIHKSKADIVREGLALIVPYHYTWSCYKGENLHCGKCGTCVERLEAFQLANSDDFVDYQKDE